MQANKGEKVDIKIIPKKLCGSVKAVSSKSFAHRIITAAALADKETDVYINGFSDDILRTISCVEALGAVCRREEDRVLITPITQKKENAILELGESGTTARIMLPVCAVVSKSAQLSGTGRLPERPFADITKLLRSKGCSVSSDSLPISLSGTIKSGNFEVPGNISSQYVTGLMMALPHLEGDSTITLTTPLKSAAYVDITIDVLKDFGVNISKTETGYNVSSGKFISPGKVSVEGDWSNAAFWIVAKEMGSDVKISNLNTSSVQGDRKIMDVITEQEIDIDEIPDLFPILAVLACSRTGTTRLYNGARLRLKESDRIVATESLIKALGGNAKSGPDYLEVYGTGALKGGLVDGFNDHRIVMAAAVAATICTDEVIITGAEAVNKSYPSFFDEYKKLGGETYVI